MRKLTFTNSLGVDTVFGETTYTIESLDGLSTPGVINQDQKAPYQDGSTYIDTLLDVREIVCEGSINKPNNLTLINSAKDTLIRNLSPKLGQGWLKYEASGGVVKRIQATAHIIFNNKHAMEPFQKYQITFRCNDPYWQDITSNTKSINQYNISTEYYTGISGLNSADQPYLIQKKDGVFALAYRRSTDNYLSFKTSSDGTTWSADTLITSSSVYGPSLIQVQNGNLIVSYQNSSPALCCKISTDGISWSSEYTINPSQIGYHSICQMQDGTILVSYISISSGLCTRTSADGITWSAENVIESGFSTSQMKWQSIIKGFNNKIVLFYIRSYDSGSSYHLYYRTSLDGVTFSSENEVDIGFNIEYVSAIYQSDGQYRVSYVRVSDGYIVQRTSTDLISWSDLSVCNNSSSTSPSLIQKLNSQIMIFYRSTATPNGFKFRSVYNGAFFPIETYSIIGSTYSSLIQRADGSFAVAKTGGDTKFAFMISADGKVWTKLSTIVDSGLESSPCLVQLKNGKYVVAYAKASTFYLACKISNDGVTWGSEIIINSSGSATPSLIQRKDGLLMVAYAKSSPQTMVSRTSTDGITWSAENVINSAFSSYPSLIQKQDGTFLISYSNFSPNNIATRTSADGITWSAETQVIVSANAGNSSIMQLVDGTIQMFYVDNGYVKIIKLYPTYSSWSSPKNFTQVGASISQVQNNKNGSTAVALADRFFILSPTSITSTSHSDSPVKIKFNGPSVNPTIVKNSSERIILTLTLGSDDFIEINTEFGKKTVKLSRSGVVSNGLAYLYIGSKFFNINPGQNTLFYDDDLGSDLSYANVEWTNRYIGC